MTVNWDVVLTDSPPGTEWDYGGYPYGLEPLTLPPADCPDVVPTGRRSGDHDDEGIAARRLIGLVRSEGGLGGAVAPCRDDEQLYGFRWITGHQASFIIWWLTAQLLGQVGRGEVAPGDAASPLAGYIRAYCALLLYSGSCSPDVYDAVIRPSMRLRHPSFSGSWAADYAPLRALFRGGPLPIGDVPGSADVRDAVRLQQAIHDGIAAKLVPDGESLLRRSPVRRTQPQLRSLIYDNYFMTLRAPVSREAVGAQLLRRVVAIAQDVAIQGIDPVASMEPGVSPEDELPVELCVDEVTELRRSFSDVLARSAAYAARSAPEVLPDQSGHGTRGHEARAAEVAS